MKFVRENIKALLLVLFACVSEVIVKLFANFEHSIIDGYLYSYGEILYYFFSQVGYVSFFPALFLYKSCKNIHSRGIYLGLVVWNVIEVIQEINLLLKLNIEWLNKGDSLNCDIMQILFIIFIVVLTYYTHLKWSILSRSL